tara:strand:+ start:506 stop:931 length:426 start_codon:yes stop_codon:yes gene_type:complete
MNNKDNELFQLCQAIVDCGEFTEESIRQLSEYINNTPNASSSWPGNLLIKPLQKVWQDGVVDEFELEYLSETLKKIVQPISDEKPSYDSIIQKNEPVKSKNTHSLRNFAWVLLAIPIIIVSQFLGCRRTRRRGFWRSRRRR